MKIVAVVQARMGSTRLPGKVLKPIRDIPAICWALRAARRAVGINEVVIATSTNPENDALEVEAFNNGCVCVRGSEEDVISRYNLVLDKTGADAIVRLTADCPLLDSRVISEVIELYRSTPGCMYASNIDPPTWPDGLDCEVISAEALRIADAEATRQSDRDTVTRYIARNRHQFPAQTLICPIKNMHKERWVLDSPEDYDFISAIFAEFPVEWVPNYIDIINLLRRKPELRKLLGSHWRNQRFFEALAVEGDKKTNFNTSNVMLGRASSVIPFGAQTFSKSHLQFPHEAPLFLSHGSGGYAFDVDGNDYVDLVSALLPNVLGYCDPDVDWAIREQLNSGISLSLSTELEARLANKLIELIPCAEMVKFGKNGSDVTAAAVRVARAYTGREKVAVLEKGYHGWQDWAVANSQRDLGVPTHTKHLTRRLSGDLEKIKRVLSTEKYAAIVLEPEGRSSGYLRRLQEITQKYGTLLVFDEVITGFRWHLGGYQAHIGVTPDLATFGKAMANGMPLSALVGKMEIMRRFNPPNNVFYSGTFFGEALSLAASLTTIKKMEDEDVIGHLWSVGGKLRDAVADRIAAHRLAMFVGLGGDGPLVRLYFRGDGQFADAHVAGLFRKYMIQNGVLVIASHNLCFAHGPAEAAKVLRSYDEALGSMEEAMRLHPRADLETITVTAGVRS